MSSSSDTVKNNYIMEKMIGKGSFGIVYLAHDKHKAEFAAKVEQISDSSRLCEEYKIYKVLHKKKITKSIAKIHSFIQTDKCNIMVMDLLGPSLDTLFTQCNKKFNLSTVLLLGLTFVNILESVHNAGFLHRDIKPNNFLVSKHKDDDIYLTDFGLSKSYLKNKQHIVFATKKNLIGTLRYASVNMHMKIEPTRRDDLESVGYMLVYFFKGSLPWQGIKTGDDESRSIQMDKIGDIKLTININKLCDGMPKQIAEYIKYCRDLKFAESPDYEKLKNYFLDAALDNNIDLKYQWCS